MNSEKDSAVADASMSRLLLFLKQHLLLKKDMPSNEVHGVFGAPLSFAVQHGCVTPFGLCVPTPVYRCFSEIVERGLKTEGIFRLSGAASDVNDLQLEFDQAPDFGKCLDLSTYDIHTIVSTLKKYLRMLPEPVIPTAYHDMFLEAADACSTSSSLLKRLEELVNQLPNVHGHLLHCIILLASYIEQYQHINMMNSEALAIVISPVCTGLDHHLKGVARKKRRFSPATSRAVMGAVDVEDLLKRNTTWKRIWMLFIEHHEYLRESWRCSSRSFQSPMGRNTIASVPSAPISRPSSTPSTASSPSPAPPFHILMSQFQTDAAISCEIDRGERSRHPASPGKPEPRKHHEAIGRRRLPRKYTRRALPIAQMYTCQYTMAPAPSGTNSLLNSHSPIPKAALVQSSIL